MWSEHEHFLYPQHKHCCTQYPYSLFNGGLFFQQNSARCHEAKLLQEYCKEPDNGFKDLTCRGGLTLKVMDPKCFVPNILVSNDSRSSVHAITACNRGTNTSLRRWTFS